ncbi:MAG TPA: protein kinase, partial [Planctomycetaceae bacterium]|nr:protein kinase [Planctomycetaceae bacterium]
MTLAAGTRLGAYDVLALIGAGGMGQVYRARDTRLQRDVALKVLPDLWADDPDRLARFQREAQVLASLNHPHIAAIYGLEESPPSTSSGRTVRALVLELVEGPTLADRIAKGPIPVDESLAIARQIAEALEAAHEHGVVHRDLKPANIKLRPDGTVKVLDFGLAKAMAGDAAMENISQSPTLTGLGTQVGLVLGTAAYMAPEQARGKAADARSDIWAFGVILLEMLTGKSAFGGETIVEVLSGVLRTDPDWTELPATTPPIVRSLLHRCLQKDRSLRLRAIADARFQVEEGLTQPGLPATVTPARTGRERLWWTAALFLALAATAAAALYFRPAAVEAPEARFEIVTPPAGASVLTQLAISPDGRQLVFAATTEGKTEIWLRRFGSQTPEPIPGTDGARYPFWSPDSRQIGFFADQKLKRIQIAGGAAQTLADGGGDDNTTYGGTWNADGTILFGLSNAAPIYRVAAAGGKTTEATRVESQQIGHRFPYFLPDGHHFLFFATGRPGVQGVYLGSVDAIDARRLFDADTAAVFAPPDHVLFVRQETLFAQRLDLPKLEPVGEPFPVAEQLVVNPSNFASVALSASAAGPLVYRTAVPAARQLMWFDRSGKQTGTIGEPDTADPSTARPSPDGRTVALTRRVGGNIDVWLTSTVQGIPRRFTFDAATDQNPAWSPDGSRIFFQSARKGGGFYDLYQKPVTGGGVEELLFESAESKNMMDCSPDGRFILYASQNPKTARDLWALPLEGARKPFAVVQTSFEENGGRFSPDGRWIAYHSNESGRNEVYVQPFPGPGPNARISTNGGTNVQWRGDGREIFYQAPDNRLMAVPITMSADGRSVDAGRPVALFATRSGAQYAAASNGQRFLINTPLEEATTPPITIVLN